MIFRVAVPSHITKCEQWSFEIDGAPYAVKVARTVWTGGKDGDAIKVLPIGIVYGIAITAMEFVCDVINTWSHTRRPL